MTSSRMLRAPSGSPMSTREIELGADLAHRDRLEVRQSEILGRQLLGRREGGIRHCRRADVEIETGAVRAMAGLVRLRRAELVVDIAGIERGQARGGPAVMAVLAAAAIVLRQHGLELALVDLPGIGGAGGLR